MDFIHTLIANIKKGRSVKQRALQFWSIEGSIFLLASSSVTAQVIPDKTLPVNSIVTSQDNTRVIDGGTIKGSNLFHSFEQFSVTTGSTVLFNNAQNIQNIFSRVTGSSVSNIDGLLKAKGTANLFLINPNGIIFGKNARLDIGGSFLVSTAKVMKFADGFEFRANNSQTKPLLTISVPIGLQLGSDSGGIQVLGTSEGLTAPSSIGSPTIRNNDVTGLRMQLGKTLALVGGDVSLAGGSLIADQGRIELGSVADGTVSLNPVAQGFALSYPNVQRFGNISLSQKALADASGVGSIQIQGNNIKLTDGSAILIQNQSSHPSGSINVNATGSLELSGISSKDGRFTSILRTESLDSGSAGDINLFTNNLVVQGGAGIGSRTYSDGQGGNITVNASDSIKLLGFSSFNPFITSSIINSTLTNGKAGDITVSTDRLIATDGGVIISLTLGTGAGGNVILNVINSVELTNSKKLINSGLDYVPSYFATTDFHAGNAGSLTINTSRLMIGQQARVSSSTVGSGSAGSITINASDLDVSGRISSSVVMADQDTQQLFASPQSPSGNPGGIKINTENLSLMDGGIITVTNQGISNAGTILINAKSISLDNKSAITATTANGEGGNIFVNARYLQLSNHSTVTATAGNKGNGGNININADVLTAWRNSSITADAFEGRGGNITINAQGLFFSPDSLITASSKYGINGTVKYNIADTNIYPTQIKAEVIPITPQITPVCQAPAGTEVSSFRVSSTRNLQSQPNNLMSNNVEQSNSVPVPAFNNSHNPKSLTSNQPIQIIEANILIRDSQGNLVLTTDQANPTWDNASLSASSCFSGSQ